MRRLATMGSSRNLSAQKGAGRNWLNALSEAAGHRAFFWGLLAVIFIGVLAGHQSLEVIDRDEARFAQASKQMLLSGDLITPYFMDELRAKKPIAIYWLQSASAAIFGHLDIASYRLPSVLGILAALILTYKFAASLWPSTRFLPIIAALLLAATPVMIGEAHLAKTDAVLLAAILCQQFYLWRIYQRHSLSDAAPRGSRLFIGFWAFMAAGILIKGPIAPLVALTTISMLVILDRQVAWLAGLAVFRGSLILAVLTLPWVVAVSYQTDGAFLDIAIRGDFLSKVKSGQESHGAPIGTYFGLLGLLFWPGIAFIGFLVWQGRDMLRHPASRFCVAWIAGYWLAIELVPTKLPHYVLPVLPALALLVAGALVSPLPPASRIQRGFILAGYILAVIWGAVLVAASLWLAISYGGRTGGWAFIWAVVISLLVSFILWRLWNWYRGHHLGDLLAICGAGLAVHLVLIAGLFASLSQIHIAHRLKNHIVSLPDRPAAIALVGYHEPSAVFHLGQDILLLDVKQAALFMAEAPDGLAIIEGRHRAEFIQLSQRLDQQLAVSDTLSGVNISKGRDIQLFFYQHVAGSQAAD